MSENMPEIIISQDGDMVCVLQGENLQEGVAGFGRSLKEAFEDFITNFTKESVPHEQGFYRQLLEMLAK